MKKSIRFQQSTPLYSATVQIYQVLQSMLENQLKVEANVKTAGKYKIFMNNKIGTGARGNVYRCENIQNNQMFAMKMIDISKLESNYRKEAIRDIYSQYEFTSKIIHPNILSNYQIFQSSNNIYIVSQLFTGTLTQIIKVIQFKDTPYLIYQILLAGEELSRKKIIHRNLNEDNILYAGSFLKIADFEVAIKQDTEFHSISGTPFYMAPQYLYGLLHQIKQMKYTSKADVWSVGVLAFKIIFKRLPFQGKSDDSLLQNIRNKCADQSYIFSKQEAQQLINKQLQSIIESMLTISQDQRPSFSQLLQLPFFKYKFPNTIGLKVQQQKMQFLLQSINIQLYVQSQIYYQNSADKLNKKRLHFQKFFSIMKHTNLFVQLNFFQNIVFLTIFCRKWRADLEQFKRFYVLDTALQSNMQQKMKKAQIKQAIINSQAQLNCLSLLQAYVQQNKFLIQLLYPYFYTSDMSLSKAAKSFVLPQKVSASQQPYLREIYKMIVIDRGGQDVWFDELQPEEMLQKLQAEINQK